MTNDEVIDILKSIRPNRPQTLKNKKLQGAIDSAITIIDTYNNILSKAIISKDGNSIIRLKGKWKPYFGVYICSCCNLEFSNNYKFCPNCGADMQETIHE